MPKSAMIRARIDPHLKDEVDAILQQLGISTTQALTLFYQQIRMQKGIPFDVRLPNPSTKASGVTPSSKTSVPFPVNAARSAMKRNTDAYHEMHGDLVRDYLGQYIALLDGELIDADSDPVALLSRVRKRYPGQVVMRQKVERLPDQVIHIRHPSLEEVT